LLRGLRVSTFFGSYCWKLEKSTSCCFIPPPFLPRLKQTRQLPLAMSVPVRKVGFG
jgi:hypothetical protein